MAEEDIALIVEKLAANEEAIGELYHGLAEKFPEKSEFWNKLSEEEKQHARWIHRLNARIAGEEGFGRVLADRFSVEEIEQLLEVVIQIAEEAKGEDFTLGQALEAALSIEKSLLEKKYFEIFEGEQAEINQVLVLLAKETADHADRIQNLIKDPA